MRYFKLLSLLLLTGIITACGGSGTSAPSEYMVKVYPIENDFDRFEEVGPVSVSYTHLTLPTTVSV